MNHCIVKIVEIIARGEGSRRDILQLGYNLGRLSELTGLGREAFWDRWKGPVSDWDQEALSGLASDLLKLLNQHPIIPPSDHDPRPSGPEFAIPSPPRTASLSPSAPEDDP